MSVTTRYGSWNRACKRLRLPLGLVLAMGSALGFPGAGMAVEFGRAVIGDTVADRVHADYDPIGIRAGSFMILPSVDVRGEYSDNIYAERTNRVSDFIVGVTPTIAARSLWERHALRVTARGSFGFYADNSGEDYQDADISTEGRLDIAEGSTLSFDGIVARRHEGRESPDDARGDRPTIYYRIKPELTWNQRINRISLRLRTGVEHLDFNDTMTSTGVVIDEDDRDRLMWTVEGRAGMDVSNSVQAYVSALFDDRNYDQAIDGDGFNRDSTGYGVFGGVIVELTGTISGEAFVGYRNQSFKDPLLTDISGIAGGLNIIWAPTKLTTVTLTGERKVEETTVFGGAGSFTTAVGVTVDHELRRNLVITLSGRHVDRHYEGVFRNDDEWEGRLGMQYLFNRHFRLRAGYTYSTRKSTAITESFDMNAAYVNLHVDY
jgi:hypothetical protein